MKILCISGSARADSSNSKLLNALQKINDTHHFHQTYLHFDLPIFKDDDSQNNSIDSVRAWQNIILDFEGVIISTPEYIHNIPAVLKNAFEWLTASGELSAKKVIAISYTPHAPRGEKSLQSLLWSLQALDCNILTSLSIYKNTLNFNKKGALEGEDLEMLTEALRLF